MAFWTCITDDGRNAAIAAASHRGIAVTKEGLSDYVLTFPLAAADLRVTALQTTDPGRGRRLTVVYDGLQSNQVRIHTDVPGRARTFTVIASSVVASSQNAKRRPGYS